MTSAAAGNSRGWFLGAHGLSPRHGASHQRTLKNAIGCKGTGLHSGSSVAMTLCPAEAGSGIVFRRTDGAARGIEIAAHVDNVVDGNLSTVIGDGNGTTVGTIEHLMAAFAGCGVDNVLIDIDGPEVPIMDGSAAPFVFLIECAGVVAQSAPRRAIEVLKPMQVGDATRSAAIVPGDGFAIDFRIDFDNAAIGGQVASVRPVNGTFKREIAPARTFGFAHEVDGLRARGLVRGGTLDNAIVIRDGRVINEGGLRYRDEFVRHKVLDCLGDLYLAGAPLIGHVKGCRSGHALNHALVRALLADESAWRFTTETERDEHGEVELLARATA